MNTYKPEALFSYAKLRKILKQRRMSISAFGKRTGISRADLHMMQIDELMSPEGEYRACFFLKCDTSDIRDMWPADPKHKDFTYLLNHDDEHPENDC